MIRIQISETQKEVRGLLQAANAHLSLSEEEMELGRYALVDFQRAKTTYLEGIKIMPEEPWQVFAFLARDKKINDSVIEGLRRVGGQQMASALLILVNQHLSLRLPGKTARFHHPDVSEICWKQSSDKNDVYCTVTLRFYRAANTDNPEERYFYDATQGYSKDEAQWKKISESIGFLFDQDNADGVRWELIPQEETALVESEMVFLLKGSNPARLEYVSGEIVLLRPEIFFEMEQKAISAEKLFLDKEGFLTAYPWSSEKKRGVMTWMPMFSQSYRDGPPVESQKSEDLSQSLWRMLGL